MASTNAFSREKLFEIARTLPAAPRVLANLSELVQDVNVGLDDISDLIKRDAPLAARIVRMSNSVVYGGSGGFRIGAIDEAVNRVGLSEVHRLVGLVTSDRLVDRHLKFYGITPQQMREHMLLFALATESIADECGLDPRNAYTAGLLRTMGILVLDRVAERFGSCTPYQQDKHSSYILWEGISFSIANPEVAGMVLADWRFPPEIVKAIREHYLRAADDYDNSFACALNVAGSIVVDAGYALPGEIAFWKLDDKKMGVLGLSEERRQQAAMRAQTMFERHRVSVA
jgi:HD-like signal output (HDOD) protein